MQKIWDSSKVDLYFDDVENDKIVRRSFQNVVEKPSDQQIAQFTKAVANLSALPSLHSSLVHTNRYDYSV